MGALHTGWTFRRAPQWVQLDTEPSIWNELGLENPFSSTGSRRRQKDLLSHRRQREHYHRLGHHCLARNRSIVIEVSMHTSTMVIYCLLIFFLVYGLLMVVAPEKVNQTVKEVYRFVRLLPRKTAHEADTSKGSLAEQDNRGDLPRRLHHRSCSTCDFKSVEPAAKQHPSGRTLVLGKGVLTPSFTGKYAKSSNQRCLGMSDWRWQPSSTTNATFPASAAWI